MIFKIRNLALLAGLLLVITGGVSAQQARELRVGTTVNGNLRAGEELWYSVRPTAAGMLIVETSGDKDTYLELYDSSNNLIASDDDGGENYNARISILSEAGRTYLFKFRFLSESESGPYSIRANMGTIAEMRLDTWVTRNYNSEEDHWFSVRSSAAGLMIIETSGDLDTYLDVYTSSNNHIISDDDGGDNFNARVSFFTEAGGTYLVKFRCVGGSGFGSYRIRANMGTVSELRLNTWVPRSLGIGEDHWFNLRPSASGPLLIETSGNFDTYLRIYNSSNNIIFENNTKLEFFAEAGKTYFVKLSSPGGYESGSYNLRATASSISEMRLGSWVSGNIQGSESRWFNVRASAAGVIIVETSGNTDTFLRAYNSSGNLIKEDDDSGVDYNARFEIFTEANSTYIIQLTQLGSDNSPYRILASFETIPADVGNTSRARAVPVRPGEPVSVFLRSADESRWYSYNASGRGTMLTIRTAGNMDTMLVLYDGQGRPIAENDDYEDNNAYISETIGAGTVYIEVKAFGGRLGRTTLNIEAWQRQ